jgi:hypothetical protein
MPLAGGNGLSLNSPSDGADERLSVERPLRLLSGFDKLTTALTLAGVGGGGPRGRLELVVLAKLVADPCNFLNCGISPLGNTSLAPAGNHQTKHFSVKHQIILLSVCEKIKHTKMGG